MANHDFICGVPLWTISHLGRAVKLGCMVDSYGDGEIVYPAGSSGRLDAIQARDEGLCAVVEFSDGDLVSVPFDSLRPG